MLTTDNIFNVSYDRNEEEAIETLFNYYRSTGFPNYDKEKYNPIKEIEKLVKFDETQLLNNKNIKQTMHSCGFLWTYFPHWIDVSCNDDSSLRENWNDDDKLRALIKKTYRWQLKYGSGYFTENRIRQNAKVYCSKQTVSNFRPTAAKYIYNTFGNNGVVWDMCCGWGGRLLGFLSSNCKTYIGTEPSIKTYEGLLEIEKDCNILNKNVEIHNCGSEDFIPEKDSLDLCFTSPPYFDTEKYSDEDTQSYIKYPTMNDWINGYLKSTINNCYQGLKQGGYLVVNISNTTKYQNIEEDFIKIVEDIGFEYVDTYGLILSSISGKGVKLEPIFIYKK